jgi:hypothetical protein
MFLEEEPETGLDIRTPEPRFQTRPLLALGKLSFTCFIPLITITQWPESASELYRPSDRRLLAKLVPTFTDRGCHVDSVANP